MVYTLHLEPWEGLFKISKLLGIRYFGGNLDLINSTYFNSSRSNVPFKKLTLKASRKECIRGLHTNNQRPFVWVYDITKLSDNHNCLVEGAPFKTKTECAEILKTTRKSVTLYLDSDKIFNNKWIFSSTALSKDELSKWVVPSKIWEILTGELLGDGYISYDPLKNPLINGRI